MDDYVVCPVRSNEDILGFKKKHCEALFLGSQRYFWVNKRQEAGLAWSRCS